MLLRARGRSGPGQSSRSRGGEGYSRCRGRVKSWQINDTGSRNTCFRQAHFVLAFALEDTSNRCMHDGHTRRTPTS